MIRNPIRLKFCPFCGNKGAVEEKKYALPTGAFDSFFRVKCMGASSCAARTNWHSPEAAAIEAWNRRFGGRR